MTKRILLGEVVGAHGIKGEVIVRAYTGDPGDIGAYGPLSDEAGVRVFEVASARDTGKGVIVRLRGIATRNDAEALRGIKLFVPRAALPPPAEGEFYHEDLIGLRAISLSGAPIGRVVAMQNFGAGDLLEIQLAGSQQTEFIPFTDTYAPTVDIAAGTIVVILPVMVDDAVPGEGRSGNAQ